MKLQALTTTALLALIPSLAASASQDAGGTSATVSTDLPAARTIIDNYLEKTGAGKLLSSTSSTRTKGKVELLGMGISGPTEILLKKPDKMAVTMSLGAMGTVRQGFDGTTAWQIHPMMGANIQEGAERLQTVLQAQYTAVTKSPDLFEKVETVAKTQFEGKDCWRIEVVVKLPDGMDATKTKAIRTSFEYYDVETGLLAGQESISASPMGEVRVVQTFSNYKKFGERLLPAEMIQEVTGQKIKLTTDSVVYDDVEDSAFELPPEIKAQVEAKN